jgi:hypothetical protein
MEPSFSVQNKESSNSSEFKKNYCPPKLIEYGDLSAITNGTGSGSDDMVTSGGFGT